MQPPPHPGYGAPPAGGFGAPVPAGVGPPAPAWPPPPPRRSRFTFVQIVRIGLFIICLPALVLVVAVIVSFERDKKGDLVVFHNRLDAPAEVAVDGKVVTTIKPRSTFWIHPTVKLPPGAKKIVVTSNGQIVSEAALSIRERAEGETHGYRGLYVIGPVDTDYAVAKMPYYAEEPDEPERPSLRIVPRPAPLTELPRELESFEISSIDGVFSKSEKMPKGAKMVWKTQLCTVESTEAFDAADSRSRKIGCSGFAADEP